MKFINGYWNSLTVNDISLTCDKTIKSHLVVLKGAKHEWTSFNRTVNKFYFLSSKQSSSCELLDEDSYLQYFLYTLRAFF